MENISHKEGGRRVNTKRGVGGTEADTQGGGTRTELYCYSFTHIGMHAANKSTRVGCPKKMKKILTLDMTMNCSTRNVVLHFKF